MIVRHEAAAVICKALAQKRDCRVCTRSLNEPVETGDGAGTVERITTVSSDMYCIQTGRQTRPASELQILAIDLKRVLDRLAPELVSVARLLAEGETPAEAATILNTSRSTNYRRIVRIRTAFHDAGFESHTRLQEAA
jgi:DNA-binding NarL/FixJ family response regulator